MDDADSDGKNLETKVYDGQEEVEVTFQCVNGIQHMAKISRSLDKENVPTLW